MSTSKLIGRSVLLCLFGFVGSAGASTIGYDAILAIVIVELIFAFSVGVVCIIFSFNLLRALKDADTEYSDIGDLPARVRSSQHTSRHSMAAMSSAEHLGQTHRRRSSDSQHDYKTFSDEHLDEERGHSVNAGISASAEASGTEDDEEEETIWGLVGTFVSYLRLW